MLIAYRPELENPPREGAFGFFLKDGTTLRLVPGVNHDISQEAWNEVKGMDIVQRLMQLEAIKEIEDETPEILETPKGGLEEFLYLKVEQAMLAVDSSVDADFLKKWHDAEKRVRVRSAIARRLEAIRTGRY